MSKFVILPKNCLVKKCTKCDYRKTCIVFHLYYLDEIDLSITMIESIPKEIDVYIITANQSLVNYLNKNIERNTNIILKENRGRDFAALFIVGDDFIWNYDYVCFVHDKKSHNGENPQIGIDWYKSFLDNLIGNGLLIQNIINYLKDNKNIGLLATPLPTKYFFDRRRDFITANNKKMKLLLKKLNIKVKIDNKYEPVGLGTGFWFKPKALIKIKKLHLSYEDFENEPMSYDGGYSHALERILDVIIHSVGYESAFLLNDKFACDYCKTNNDLLGDAAEVLRDNKLLKCSNGMVDFSKEIYKNSHDEMIEFSKNYKKIFVILDSKNKKAVNYYNKLLKHNITICNKYDIENINYNDINAENYYGCVIISSVSLDTIVKKLKKIHIDYYIENI